MRKWRVGTFSMGISLVLLGASLLLSMVFHFEAMQVFWSWWPAILVILGLEILVYVYFSKSEQPFVKYDIFSILFIGILGMLGILFFLLSSVGVVEEVTAALGTREETVDFPSYDAPVSGDVQKIVLDIGKHSVHLEGIDDQQVSIFGTYRIYGSGEGHPIKHTDDYVTVNRKGDVLYLSLKELPRNIGLASDYISSYLTVTVPRDIQLVVKGEAKLNLRPGQLQTDWVVQGLPQVDVYLSEESDLQLNSTSPLSVSTENNPWLEEVQVLEERDETIAEPFIMGEGSHRIQFLNTGSVNVFM